MPRGHRSLTRVAPALAILLVAGNALVRGGVWLSAIAASSAIAVAALSTATSLRKREPIALPVLVIGLSVTVALIGLQLVPLPPAVHRTVSPRVGAALDEALAPLALWPAWRPLSLDPGATALELAKAAMLTVVAAIGAVSAGSDRWRDRILSGIALSGVAVTVVHHGAVLLGFSQLLESRITFVNPNHLAGFLQLAAWPALGFALRARGPARAGWLLAFAFTASGIFLSLSRAGIAAFFVAAGLFGVLRLWAEPRHHHGLSAALPGTTGDLDPAALAAMARHKTRILRSRMVIAAGISAAVAVAAWLALDAIVKEMATVGDRATTAVKLGLWPIVARMIRDFPLGIGRGAFATTFPAYQWEPFDRTFTHVENEWLQLPLELGVLPGIAVIALFGWAFLSAARRRDLSRPLAGAIAGAGALVAHNIFDFSLEIPGVAIPFALVAGIASASMPRVEVRPWVVRTAAGVLLLVGIGALCLHRLHRTDADAERVVAAASADEAIGLAREALRYHPADYVPQAAVGAKLADENRCREALPWLLRAMRRNPTAAEPHRSMAGCLARSGQDAFAKREYRLAFTYGDQSALAEAHAYYDRPGELLEIAPDTQEGLIVAGQILRSHPEEAAEAWRRAWESFGNRLAVAELAVAKLALAENDEALQLARVVQRVAPQDATGYSVAARALEALDRGEEAEKELELGIARLPGNPGVLVPLGSRQMREGRYSQARATFERIVARDAPTMAQKHVLVGRTLEAQGRYQEALREMQAAREAWRPDSFTLNEFARLAARVGRFDEAIDALETASRAPAADAADYEARIAELRAARDEQRTRRLVQGDGAR